MTRTINWKLKAAFALAGTSQVAVSRKTGMEYTRLSHIIHGVRPATDTEKRILAKALKQSVSALFGDEDEAEDSVAQAG